MWLPEWVPTASSWDTAHPRPRTYAPGSAAGSASAATARASSGGPKPRGRTIACCPPVFGVPRKGAPLGAISFGTLRAGVGVPVVALGGIEVSNAGEVLAAGADGLAAIRCLRDGADPEGAARILRTAVDANRSEHAAG